MLLRDEISSVKRQIAALKIELADLEEAAEEEGCLDEEPHEDSERIRFVLDGCDISFVAEAPADITLRQLLAQCDKIRPDWCACGIRSFIDCRDYEHLELVIDYNSISKADESASCTIMDDPKWRSKREQA